MELYIPKLRITYAIKKLKTWLLAPTITKFPAIIAYANDAHIWVYTCMCYCVCKI